MKNVIKAIKFDIEHFEIRDKHIMDSLSFNRII